MPVFTPPARAAVPPVLPPWSGREAQTITSYRLFRHYRSRPEGINVYLLSDGSITESDPDGTSVVWSINDRTGDAINARYVVVAWYGGHDNYYVTTAQADALVAEGYNVDYDSDYLATKVVWFGSLNSFGDTIAGTSSTSQGHSFSTRPVTWSWPAGQSIWIPALTDDGVLILPGTPQTSNAFRPTGTSLMFGRWSPTGGALAFETIPTSTGSTNPLSVSYGITGGADFEDIARYGDGEEKYLLCVGRPNNDFTALDGDYPCFVVLVKQAGVWTYDNTGSRTAAQMAASNPTAAAHIYGTGLNGAGVTITSNRNTTELAVFEDSGDIIVAHYDDASGAGYTGGALTLMDSSLDLQAGYLLPNVENPTDHPISVRARGIESDPTSTAGDERFVVAYDVFDSDGLNPAGVLLDGSTNTAINTPDSDTWNVAGLLEATHRMKLPGTAPAANVFLFGHHEPTGNQRSWALFLSPARKLVFVGSSAGTAANINVTATTALSADWGEECWVGLSYNTVTGATAMYEGPAQEAEPALWGDWTSVYSQTLGAITFFNANCSLSIGGTGSFLGSLFTGTVYRTAIYDDGALIADANFQADGSPLAAPNSTGTYTDSLGNVWTLRGAARTDLANRFTFSEFSTDGTSITAVSAPITVPNPAYRPEQVKFDEVGNLWVTTTFSGLFNGEVHVYEKESGERSYVTDWPASTSAWLNGDGTTTSEYARVATPAAIVDGTAVGSLAAGMVWDDDAKVMYVSAGGGILLAIGRTGTSAPYTYTFLGQTSFLSNSAPGSNNITRPILDSTNGVVYIGVRQLSSGTYPYAPQVLDQWVVGVRTNFWE